MLRTVIPLLVLLSVSVGLFSTSLVWAEESMIFSVNSLSEFKVGEYPFISGTAQDNNEKPI